MNTIGLHQPTAFYFEKEPAEEMKGQPNEMVKMEIDDIDEDLFPATRIYFPKPNSLNIDRLEISGYRTTEIQLKFFYENNYHYVLKDRDIDHPDQKDIPELSQIIKERPLRPQAFRNYLTTNKLNPDTTRINGELLIFLLIRTCNLEFIKILVEEFFADIEIPNEQGLTPILYAAQLSEHNFFQIIRYFARMGADVNAQSNMGNSLLGLLLKKDYSQNPAEAIRCNLVKELVTVFHANPYLVNVLGLRAEDLVREHSSTANWVSHYTMFTDANHLRIKNWRYSVDDKNYYLYFSPNLCKTEKIWQFKNICNAMLSHKTDDPFQSLGLASDVLTYFDLSDGLYLKKEFSYSCWEYALSEINFDTVENACVLVLEEKHADNEFVHIKIREIFARMKLQPRLEIALEEKIEKTLKP